MIDFPENDVAVRIGEGLLITLGNGCALLECADHPAIAWKRAGLLELSGAADGPPKMVPLPLASAADCALMALKALSGKSLSLPQHGALLLGERSRLMGLRRNGASSPTGHCRLLSARDGRLALNLARDDDWGLMDAWLEMPASDWQDISIEIAERSAAEMEARGAALGLAVALDKIPALKPWLREKSFKKNENQSERPLVVDLSSLWAGPLAGNLLHLIEWDVIKVESLQRPDGARGGNAEFYQLLNAGKRCAAFDFTSPEGRAQLKSLIAAADVVIEASRPRALRQLGIEAETLLAGKPGKIWLRLMAYGDDENRIGFGDDIGVLAGLPSVMEQSWGQALMVGDAIADPLSGLYAALAIVAKWRQGGGCLLELSMRDVVRHAMQIDEAADLAEISQSWQAMAKEDNSDLYPMRPAEGKAAALGEHTAEILASLA